MNLAARVAANECGDLDDDDSEELLAELGCDPADTQGRIFGRIADITDRGRIPLKALTTSRSN